MRDGSSAFQHEHPVLDDRRAWEPGAAGLIPAFGAALDASPVIGSNRMARYTSSGSISRRNTFVERRKGVAGRQITRTSPGIPAA